jgi:ElaB/YqjD/DUF883 family membrane-anchored ribosome-binding protein
MNIEERLNRIEHFSAAADEQRRKDRETDRALWRDTQRQLNELTIKLADLAENAHAADDRLRERIEQADQSTRARDQELRDRIEAMTSAMGGYIRDHPPTT